MTKVAVVAYPTLEGSDHQWIESVRERHDPQVIRIGAHFTLIFPVEVATQLVVEHASAILRKCRSISFVLRRAEPVPDRIAGGGHVFLVPEEGRDELTTLHDRLYDGPLRPHLRADMPFLPHITVGGHENLGECERLAQVLNRAHLAIRGTVRHVDVIEVSSQGVKPLRSFGLEHHAPRNNEM